MIFLSFIPWFIPLKPWSFPGHLQRPSQPLGSRALGPDPDPGHGARDSHWYGPDGISYGKPWENDGKLLFYGKMIENGCFQWENDGKWMYFYGNMMEN